MRNRSREESRTVPDPNTRCAGRPENSWAAIVTTSTGLVTTSSNASGARATRAGTRSRHIATLAAARSSRVWPGSCLAPAVITMTSASAHTARSSLPVISAIGVNCIPWFRSRTSARTFCAFRSNSHWRHTPRIWAA